MKPRHARNLDAAGITDPGLRADFERCRVLHAEHGRTYYLATLLLPPAKRPYVHSLYGYARYADELVDNGPGTGLAPFLERSLASLRSGAPSGDAVTRALACTVERWGVPLAHVEAFGDSMLMDLTVTEYKTYADLRGYMHGSAAVIGLQMTPILEPLDPEAYERAAALGEAFQLTNFLRDVAEDLDRGRLYLPLEDLAAAGLTRADVERRVVTRRFRELMRYEVDRTRRLYTYAAGGVPMLAPSSRDCVRAAHRLYGGILSAIEARSYDVFAGRASVGVPRRLAVALPAYARARAAR